MDEFLSYAAQFLGNLGESNACSIVKSTWPAVDTLGDIRELQGLR